MRHNSKAHFTIAQGLGPNWVVYDRNGAVVANVDGIGRKLIEAGIVAWKMSLYDADKKQFTVGTVAQLQGA